MDNFLGCVLWTGLNNHMTEEEETKEIEYLVKSYGRGSDRNKLRIGIRCLLDSTKPQPKTEDPTDRCYLAWGEDGLLDCIHNHPAGEDCLAKY